MRRISILNSDAEVPVGDCKSPTISANPFASIPARRAGFTLIELLIVIAIVGVLTAIAYPSFMAQMRKGHRAAAQSYMMDLAQRQGQYLIDARSYAPTASTLGPGTPPDVASYYTITMVVPALASPPTFAITATPAGWQSPDGPLTLDEQGAKTPPDKW